MVDCSRTFLLVYIALLMTTAGFVLTLSSWFAPPINRFVYTVRIVGPCALLLGFALLMTSCLVCAMDQGRCCRCCYRLLGNRIRFKFMRSLRREERYEAFLRMRQTLISEQQQQLDGDEHLQLAESADHHKTSDVLATTTYVNLQENTSSHCARLHQTSSHCAPLRHTSSHCAPLRQASSHDAPLRQASSHDAPLRQASSHCAPLRQTELDDHPTNCRSTDRKSVTAADASKCNRRSLLKAKSLTELSQMSCTRSSKTGYLKLQDKTDLIRDHRGNTFAAAGKVHAAAGKVHAAVGNVHAAADAQIELTRDSEAAGRESEALL